MITKIKKTILLLFSILFIKLNLTSAEFLYGPGIMRRPEPELTSQEKVLNFIGSYFIIIVIIIVFIIGSIIFIIKRKNRKKGLKNILNKLK